MTKDALLVGLMVARMAKLKASLMVGMMVSALDIELVDKMAAQKAGMKVHLTAVVKDDELAE